MITRKLLIKNSFINFIAQITPLCVTIFTTPYVVHRLGMERYGLFAIVRVAVDYFSVFDCGLGIATIKFVADALGKGENAKITKIYWSTLLFVSLAGMAACAAFYFTAPTIAQRFLIVSPGITMEVRKVFMIASFLILPILIKSVLSGTIQAYQRFDLVGALNIPYAIISSLIPVVFIQLGFDLPRIVLGIVVWEFIALFVWYALSVSIIPKARFIELLAFQSFKEILSFGKWLVFQKMTTWVLFNIHTIIIGTLISVATVTYYNVPFNLTSKVGMIGAIIAPVIFPAASLLSSSSGKMKLRLFNNTLLYMTLLYGLPCLIFIVFAKEILVIWMGTEFLKSVFVTQILAVGMFLGGVSWALSIFVQVDNPKFVTLVTIVQAPIQVFLTIFLTKKIGFTGTACAWSLLCLSSVLIFTWHFWKIRYFSQAMKLNKMPLKGMAVLLMIVGLNVLLKAMMPVNLIFTGINVLILTIGYLLIAWNYFMDQEFKVVIVRKLKQSISGLSFLHLKNDHLIF